MIQKNKKAVLCLVAASCAALLSLMPGGVRAETATSSLSLAQALTEAYRNNAALDAARAELRAVDEEYAQAIAGFRPTVTGNADYISTHSEADATSTGSDPKTVSIELTQPIYSGGSTVANVDASESLIESERAQLRATEQGVMLETVTAYMNILRDQRLLELNANNEKVLSENLDAARQRFTLGDITKTDVSQSESRLAAARAGRITAEGALKRSRAAFEQVTGGLQPEGLQKPALDIVLPQTLDAAISEGLERHPDVLFARFTDAAATAASRSIKGELLPSVALTGSLDRTYDNASRGETEDSGTFALRASVPLYAAGGATYSRLRQSRETEQQRRLQVRDVERNVRQSVIEAWENLAATRAEKEARVAQIEAARTALEGVRLERDYGSRTTLDLLDAEQENLDAQVAFTSSDRDYVVASYSLLAAVGRLTAEELRLAVEYYNPQKNFQKIKNTWFGGK